EAYLEEQVERLPEGADQPPQQTIAFQRVLQRAAMHVQSAGKEEVDARDVLVAVFREPESHAAHLLGKQGITRLDVVSYLSHGVAEVRDGPAPAGDDEDEDVEDADGPRPVRDPLAAFTVDLVEQAAAGKIDPLIGRAPELERAVQVLCRRRKNNPVFV